MTALASLLARRIQATGPITVAEFMTEALQHPQHGYYATRDPLGLAGDFITAPEISQVFGELIGLWCADTWERMGRPDPVLLVELGPGRGTLMADALRAIKVAPDFRQALRLHLVETSAVLRARQAKALGAATPTWHDRLETVPTGPLLLVANEFLDALPIRQFERRADGWHERRVGVAADGSTLAFQLDPAPSPSAALIPARHRGAPVGMLVEVCPAALTLAANLAQRLNAKNGAALLIDYGSSESIGGATLQGVRKHGHHPILEEPGDADLTAHVDFAAVASAARSSGANVHGPVTQRDFLRALGIDARQRHLLETASVAQADAVRTGVTRLIDPGQMGVHFKVLAFSSRDLAAPAGFEGPSP